MREAQHKGGGVYRVDGVALLAAPRRELPDALPPEAGGERRVYGWIGGACPAPSRSDRYVVEFLGRNEFRILAYVDRFGRAFSADEPVLMPPARRPDLEFARFSAQPDPAVEQGCVQVHDDAGEARQVARYTFRRGRYALFDSWHDFGQDADDLTYDDVMARAYLAFVHRPAHGGAPVPARGLADVFGALRNELLVPALRTVVGLVDAAQADPALRPPALAECLVRMLGEAGFSRLDSLGVPDDALRLVRTAHYANTYFVARAASGKGLADSQVWALESALNRFLLVHDELGEQAAHATEEECLARDRHLFEAFPRVDVGRGASTDVPPGAAGGEWQVRCAICSAVERLRLPARVEAQLRLDLTQGTAAFDLTVPDAALMPKTTWRDPVEGDQAPAAARPTTPREREQAAQRFAMHAGVGVALAAFRSSPDVRHVSVVARPLEDEQPAAASAGSRSRLGTTGRRPALYRVTFRRGALEDERVADIVQRGDPTFLFVQAGAVFSPGKSDPFFAIRSFESAQTRRRLPESDDRELSQACAEALGARDAAGVRIDFDAFHRRIGERLANRVARTDTATEAIRAVRAEQDAARERDDDWTSEACTRLMRALAEDAVDPTNQNALLECFMGEDRCISALHRAHRLAEKDSEAAVDELRQAIAEAAALEGFVDGSTTACRSFDSYAARVCYNQAVAQARATDALPNVAPAPNLQTVAASDARRDLRLVPDSFYLCHLEVARQLERSFSDSDEALVYARRAIEVAPATVAGYRQLGRAFMLVGDMDSAATTLRDGLAVAVQPNDVAVLYYQLAYVLWKAGGAQAASACYVKSLAVSPVVALQAAAELQELVGEAQIDLPDRDRVDGLLASFGVPVAPSPQLLGVLERAAVAAVDEGLFPVARNLLALRLSYRPDDALMGVLRSLEDPPEA